MKISQTIIASLARGVLGAIPQAGDDIADIGNRISPIIKLLRPLQANTTFAQTDQSFCIVFQAQSRTSAALQVAGPVFAKGLWRLNLSLMFLSNFDNSASNTAQAYLSLVNPTPQAAQIASFHTGLASFVHLTQSIDTEVLFPDDGWSMRWDLAATAAGQIIIAEVGVIATKLL